jgi:hypothetical protein
MGRLRTILLRQSLVSNPGSWQIWASNRPLPLFVTFYKGKALKDEKFDLALVSDLGRTKETFEHIHKNIKNKIT